MKLLQLSRGRRDRPREFRVQLAEDEIRARVRSNLVRAKDLSECLDDTLCRYHKRAADSV